MTTPAASLFIDLDSLVGPGGFDRHADALAELECRHGITVAWRPSPSGPVAELVETQKPSEAGGNRDAGLPDGSLPAWQAPRRALTHDLMRRPHVHGHPTD